MEKTAQITYFDDLADRWDTLSEADPGRLQCLAELCGLNPGAKILDVACGTGIFTPYLLQKEPKQILGVDFSPRMIELAKQKCADPRVDYCCVDVMELSEGGYDCAMLYNAFPYFENRGSLTRHIHHLLAEGGRLMICHTQSRTKVNASHQLAPNLALPLPTAQTLSGTLAQYFDVDITIDTDRLYVVSGIRRRL